MILRRCVLLLLPLLLLLASGLGLGCFSETNDDLTMVSLLRGLSAAAPVADLHLYFHGYAAVWSRLYTSFPAVPWYALTLYGLLYTATVLVFCVLEKLLRGNVPVWQQLALGLLFFAVAWLEHGFWFNYVRVPLLLAGTGVLFAAQRAPARWALLVGVVAFSLAWLIRPSVAGLGLLAAAPGAWWLGGRRALPILGSGLGLAIVGAVVLQLTWGPMASTYRRLDVLKSNLNDYQHYHPTPRTAPDSLALAEARHWMLADSTLINEAMFQRVMPLRLPVFLAETAPAKLLAVLQQLARDYFPLLLALAVVAYQVARVRPRQQWVFWLVQLGFVGLLLSLGVGLKLPPRLALPLLDVWLLAGLAFLARLPAPALGHSIKLLLIVLALAAVPYALKTAHRREVLVQEQHANNSKRQLIISHSGTAKVVVTDALEETYKSVSSFSDPVFPKSVRLLSLMGWPTLDPSQGRWRQQLTGTRDFTEAMRRLATRPDVAWVLTPEGARLLNRHFSLRRQQGEQAVCWQPSEGAIQASQPFQLYVAEVN
ncbi:hypothetical protein SAMN06265337_1088 [Hymenobacter gelipurpurascens]|uniref:4-amino-4-deoxy-L-arabinose transferase n=1 Tax=Hymenobacter gelipurpurascens TaxID=89968 RepID=A0A212TF15_9BACT|nr:hypothetical protein [Hymenobacter gelipurpurascens]SNC64480.1 hypothetical protein SAMN06265337_1088 [Hymenobacter gelipurpurascens]